MKQKINCRKPANKKLANVWQLKTYISVILEIPKNSCRRIVKCLYFKLLSNLRDLSGNSSKSNFLQKVYISKQIQVF